jgi:hypothetical protein
MKAKERLSNFRMALATLLGILACAIGVYTLAQRLYIYTLSPRPLSINDSCTDPVAISVPLENPNAVLFVSCGGFIQ